MQLRHAGYLAAATAVAGVAYARWETGWFRLRRYDVPVLPPGRRPVRVLHLADVHLRPRQRRKIDWIRGLAALEPDLVINTGDSISHRAAVPAFMRAAEPLLDRPGVFVFGSNDYYAPVLKNPARYLLERGRTPRIPPTTKQLPWGDLREELVKAGWADITHRRVSASAGDAVVEVGGIDDSHLNFDRYDLIAGRVDGRADVHIGVMHSPEPRNLDRFAADGYDLLLAGHTHGGQLRLPLYGALVTNCGIDRARARGLSRHRAAWLHVSGGLGTSPFAPVRFACRPEAALLTLVPRAR